MLPQLLSEAGARANFCGEKAPRWQLHGGEPCAASGGEHHRGHPASVGRRVRVSYCLCPAEAQARTPERTQGSSSQFLTSLSPEKIYIYSRSALCDLLLSHWCHYFGFPSTAHWGVSPEVAWVVAIYLEAGWQPWNKVNASPPEPITATLIR